MIALTSEWTKSAAARAVPGSAWDPDEKAWVVHAPTPRAAAVALKLFPGLEHQYPELLELRAVLVRDAKPVDYASQLGLRIGAPRVRAAMVDRGWSLDKANVTPVGATDEYQSIDLGYLAEVLRRHGGGYLGWARGLGKTLGTAALIDELDCRKSLVVAPNTAKQATWAEELGWALPHVEVVVLPNDKAKREQCLTYVRSLLRPFVLVVHYEALAVIAGKDKKGNVGDGWKRLGIHWDIVAADEGHRLANPKAKQTKAIKKIPRTYALVLSGSVFMNSYEEMFSPLQFLFPKVYKSRWRDWNDRFLDYVENGWGKVCLGIKENMVDQLRDELGRFMVYRDKETKAREHTVLVDLTPDQRKAYEQLRDECWTQLIDGTTVKAQLGVAMLTRLRQVASGLDLLTTEVKDSSKLDAAIKIITENPDKDFVVFGWYRSSAHALSERLQEQGIESWTIIGDVKQKDRADIIKRFQAGERRVLIGSIATMGESVNLQRANAVIMLDRSWNPATNAQSRDRVDRQGQQRGVDLWQIIAKDTVDELVVLPNLANKEALRATLFGS